MAGFFFSCGGGGFGFDLLEVYVPWQSFFFFESTPPSVIPEMFLNVPAVVSLYSAWSHTFGNSMAINILRCLPLRFFFRKCATLIGRNVIFFLPSNLRY